MSDTSTDASQNMDLKEEVSIETNHIEELESEIDTDAGSNLSEKDKEKKRTDELLEIYKSRVLFSSALEIDSSTLKSSPPPELKSSLVTSEYVCLESSDTILLSIASNSTPNPKVQIMSILEE